MKNLLLLFILLILFQQFLFPQKQGQARIDSLITELSKTKEDTTKVNLLNDISFAYNRINPDKGIIYCQQALTLAEKLKWNKGVAKSNKFIGIYNVSKSEYPQALSSFFKALTICEELKNKSEIVKILGNIGVVYAYQNEYNKALDYYFKALPLNLEIGDNKELAKTYGNIGVAYEIKKDYTKALEYDFKALELNEEIGRKNSVASVLGNIGNVYYAQKNYPKALEYDQKALDIKQELGDKTGIAINLGNLGNIYLSTIQPEVKEDKNKPSTDAPVLLPNVSKAEALKKANDYLSQSISLFQQIGDLNNLQLFYESLYKIQDLSGNYKGALNSYQKHVAIRDSVFSEDNKKKISDLSKKREEDLKQKEIEIQKLQLASAKSERRYFILGILSLLLFVVIIIRSLYITRKQKVIIEEKNNITEKQKSIIEEKQKDIVDSIKYAKRIQYTLLASNDLLNANLPEHFILFKPKDIVSGDFYWATKKDNRFYLAICDSTGHGVPGAFMSVLNSTFLNEAINEKNISEPNEVLNYVRNRLISSVSVDGGQDGMDCTLLCFQGDRTSYASANNKPLLIYNNELIELNADKMPVGKGDKNDSFSNFQISLNNTIPLNQENQKNQGTLYLFTDGYADQFGGEKGNKKLTRKRFKELLLSMQHLSLEEQGMALDKFIIDYKKEVEQIDDILVMGIKL